MLWQLLLERDYNLYSRMKGFKLKTSELDVFDLETADKKKKIMGMGICYGVICTIFCGLYLARFSSVANI